MSTTDWETNGDSEQTRSRLQIVLDQYRALLYTFGVAVVLAIIGATIDAAYGPLSNETKLAHQIAGLLGATALALVVCLVIVVLLWSVLITTDR